MKHLWLYSKNKYWKFIKGEDHLQAYCVDYLLEFHPKVPWIHPPNEGKRSDFEIFKANVLGLSHSAGAPDFLIFRANEKYHGLAIELKFGNNKSTPAQIKMQTRLQQEDWYVTVCLTIEDFKNVVTNYLTNKL